MNHLIRGLMLNLYNHIITLNDVKSFFSYLVDELKVNVHPDTNFSEYVRLNTMNQTFSENEIKKGNALMEECFSVCEKCGVDIYELAYTILDK